MDIFIYSIIVANRNNGGNINEDHKDRKRQKRKNKK